MFNPQLNAFVCWRGQINKCFVNADSFKKPFGSAETSILTLWRSHTWIVPSHLNKSYAFECVLMDSSSTLIIKLMCRCTSQYWLCHQNLWLPPPQRQTEKSCLATRDYTSSVCWQPSSSINSRCLSSSAQVEWFCVSYSNESTKTKGKIADAGYYS